MKLYTVAIGNFNTILSDEEKELLAKIKEFKGLVAIHPDPNRRGTLLLFETLNDAKEARNLIRFDGYETGYNIVEIDFEPSTNTVVEGQIVA